MIFLSPPLLSLSLLLWNRNLQKIWHTPCNTISLWHWCCFNPSFLASKIFSLSNVSTCKKYHPKDSMMHIVVCSSFIRGVQRPKKVVVSMSLGTKSPLFQTRQQQKFWSSWPLGCHFQVFPLVRFEPTFVIFMSDWDRWQYVEDLYV